MRCPESRELWEQAGGPEGRDEEFRYSAEKDLREAEGMREEAQKWPPGSSRADCFAATTGEFAWT